MMKRINKGTMTSINFDDCERFEHIEQIGRDKFNSDIPDKQLTKLVEEVFWKAHNSWSKDNEGAKFRHYEIDIVPDIQPDREFERLKVVIYYEPKRVSLSEMRERAKRDNIP